MAVLGESLDTFLGDLRRQEQLGNGAPGRKQLPNSSVQPVAIQVWGQATPQPHSLELLQVSGAVGSGNSRFPHIATVASGTLSQSVPSHCDSRLQDIVTPPTPRDGAGTRSAMAAATAGTGSRTLRAGGPTRGSLLARRPRLSPPGFQSVRPKVFPRDFPARIPGTDSSSPIVILRDVSKHPGALPSISYKPKTTRIITGDLIRNLVIPQEKPQPCLIIGKKEYEKIKESARSPTEEERWDRLKTLKARQDAAFEALEKAQSEELRKAELQNERERQKDVEEWLQQEEQKRLQWATRMRLEQEEEMRELTSLFLNSKCNMIRDKQILEKRMIRKELAEEEKRLDKMMEMEWEKGVAVQEELERQRKQEMMRARQDLVKQMEQNAEKRALRDEEKYQESLRQLERLKEMKREDRKAWEQKQEQLKQIHADIKRSNVESQRLKDEQRERERLEDERVLEQQRQKAEREAALEAEQEQLRLEKEKELARLRAAQERARDWQAERDALMAKRNQEAADREWRRQELENARKKVELEQQLRRDRLEQVAQKEQYLAMQVEQDRQEFQRVLRAHQEQLEREKLQREQRELQQRAHAEDLRRQIQELRQQRERERAAFIEEGRQQEQEVRQRNRRLAQLGQQKLQEFRATGMPDKYCAQVERKAQRRANAALS
ncbi:cilia- and flagella-associated protein 45-like [Corvus hawaiiensis]|uniref:cilia- and flagella-associated protein 45-like n=1 Tax=Corvus hawaiiensis TaxID=134902 RepID=UPI0020197A29|nr:cilia- and flagella-associated protein 45-like [Corvus hawaiiensis]